MLAASSQRLELRTPETGQTRLYKARWEGAKKTENISVEDEEIARQARVLELKKALNDVRKEAAELKKENAALKKALVWECALFLTTKMSIC